MERILTDTKTLMFTLHCSMLLVMKEGSQASFAAVSGPDFRGCLAPSKYPEVTMSFSQVFTSALTRSRKGNIQKINRKQIDEFLSSLTNSIHSTCKKQHKSHASLYKTHTHRSATCEASSFCESLPNSWCPTIVTGNFAPDPAAMPDQSSMMLMLGWFEAGAESDAFHTKKVTMITTIMLLVHY